MPSMPKTPEDWLSEVSADKARGIFKLFLGYAPGVGKTYSMLSEGHSSRQSRRRCSDRRGRKSWPQSNS